MGGGMEKAIPVALHVSRNTARAQIRTASQQLVRVRMRATRQRRRSLVGQRAHSVNQCGFGCNGCL